MYTVYTLNSKITGFNCLVVYFYVKEDDWVLKTPLKLIKITGGKVASILYTALALLGNFSDAATAVLTVFANPDKYLRSRTKTNSLLRNAGIVECIYITPRPCRMK